MTYVSERGFTTKDGALLDCATRLRNLLYQWQQIMSIPEATDTVWMSGGDYHYHASVSAEVVNEALHKRKDEHSIAISRTIDELSRLWMEVE